MLTGALAVVPLKVVILAKLNGIRLELASRDPKYGGNPLSLSRLKFTVENLKKKSLWHLCLTTRNALERHFHTVAYQDSSLFSSGPLEFGYTCC